MSILFRKFFEKIFLVFLIVFISKYHLKSTQYIVDFYLLNQKSEGGFPPSEKLITYETP